MPKWEVIFARALRLFEETDQPRMAVGYESILCLVSHQITNSYGFWNSLSMAMRNRPMIASLIGSSPPVGPT